jgi:hypothetical protein
VEGRAVHARLRPAVFACSGSVCWGGFGWLTGAQPCAGSGLAGFCLDLGRLALAWRGAEVWLTSEGHLGWQIVLRSVDCAAGLPGRSICSRDGAGIASSVGCVRIRGFRHE